MAYTSGDPVVLAKALSTWVKDNAEFTFKLAIVDGKVLSVAQIGELATMPGKEEIYAKLLFLINSPAQRLATVLAATGRDFAVVINQGVEKGKFSAQAAAKEPAPEPVAQAPVVEKITATPEAAAPVVEAIDEPAVSAAAPVESAATEVSVPAVEPAAAPVEAAAAVEQAAPEVVAPVAEPAVEAPAPAEQAAATAEEAAAPEEPAVS